ncbi:hypothetical protein BATDEDRAFT_21419 [Batrachochytrium dendrobatidis JAM81]|uniref:Uncharacterized protein n=1 Tax=Batrachochytrium dendrobatidis (strain JAM81 / FGSC 10211) TaxID=684364 RepID=F4NT30_BATDJ|nr:uncharacterized protein BATDEDRAFT_21419 [Batrachochytrium dendrobatidis JAM81]EGF83075.1 hypothetical protein BATDEDRAFT_21419 [Batrachochytrium dendrobatidis JAM81]|eukprot:XP_006675282.1 hypothetical protein BATDEDRAFT_21419 [Batrachochytrium dendrobatidis JAM81]
MSKYLQIRQFIAQDRFALKSYFLTRKTRVLHRMARQVANLGRRGKSDKDFEDIRIARRKNKTGEVEQKTNKAERLPLHKPRPYIGFVIGYVGFTHNQGISGTIMALKRLLYSNIRYVRVLVQHISGMQLICQSPSIWRKGKLEVEQMSRMWNVLEQKYEHLLYIFVQE